MTAQRSDVGRLTAAKMQHLQHGCSEPRERCIYDSGEMDITAVISLSFNMTDERADGPTHFS